MRTFRIVGFAIALLASLPGCGTVFSGYYDEVKLINIPSGLKMYDQDGVEIPIQTKAQKLQSEYGKPQGVPVPFIVLRTNRDHVITLKHQGTEKKIVMHAKLGLGFFVMDIIMGGIGVIPDAVTGNWNYFNDVDLAVVQDTSRVPATRQSR